jgi:hypothetical protein
VPKLEGRLRDLQPISGVVRGIEQLYGAKKDLMLLDNNVVASARFKEVIAEIRDLGFTPGAKLPRGKIPVQRRVDFNQGMDARILSEDRACLRELATICIKPLRIAFDDLSFREPYEAAIRYANEVGLTELSNYLLYNYNESPADLYERMVLNVALNEELDIRIWSFPMRYQPTNLADRSHVGKHWTRYQLRSLQLILQATHGVVSGNPSFFNRAFGSDDSAFKELLLRPHHFIFNREWFESSEGKPVFEEYRAAMRRLSQADRVELLSLLSSCDPREFRLLPKKTANRRLRNVIQYYIPLSKQEETAIWERQEVVRLHGLEVPEDERVEDAGLEEESAPVVMPPRIMGSRHKATGGAR